jgi:hypothetical protein
MSETLYTVEKILDRRKINGQFEYKIKWEGYAMNESTWEPMKNLETIKELVEEYNRTHPITEKKRPSKASHKKNSLIQKKRKEENDEKNQQISQNESNLKDVNKINEDDAKATANENINANTNPNEKNYIIDDSLKNVVTVKQEDQKLLAVVEKLNPNGDLVKTYIPTEELRRTNPWILLNFYESKIKFS